MRFIDLNEIKDYIEKIPYSDVSAVVGNKYEDLKKKLNGNEFISWLDIEKKHLNNLEKLDIENRKIYIKDNTDWNILQKIFLREFGLKCWYSEAPMGNNDLSIDHYRPKNSSKQREKPTKYNLKHGYWWLAYDWKNYRLSGVLSNIRRRDRLKSNDEVKGKGDYFPLIDSKKCAKEKGSYLGEQPVLLDPFTSSDPGLLNFDEDGTIIIKNSNDIDEYRIKKSVEYYALDIEILNIQRQGIWNDCKNYIEKANNYWKDDNVDYQVKQTHKNICFDYLRKKSKIKEPFSSVVINCITLHMKLSDYSDLMKTFNF